MIMMPKYDQFYARRSSMCIRFRSKNKSSRLEEIAFTSKMDARLTPSDEADIKLLALDNAILPPCFVCYRFKKCMLYHLILQIFAFSQSN